MELRNINLLDLDVFARGVPHEWFTYLRKNAPVYRHHEPNGPGFWVVTKHEDVSLVERDARTFSSSAKRGGVIDLVEDPLRPPNLTRAHFIQNQGNNMLTMDPPEHTTYRNLVHNAFRRKTIARLEDEMRERAARIIEAAVRRQECDFVTDVALEFSAQTICAFLGLPLEDRYKIASWSDRMSEDPEYATESSWGEAMAEVLLYAGQLAADRRGDLSDDLISVLLREKIDAQPVPELDYARYVELLVLAGEVTTRSLLSQGMLALLEHPDQYRLLVDDASLIGTAVEEIFRWGTPALYFRRNVTRDTDIRGVEIKEGEKVSVWYISANRDEDVFEDPFRFDVRRQPNDHISFGGGRHFCLGVHLARLEARVFFEELTRRVTHVEQIGKASLLRSNFERGVKHLPVRLDGVR